MPESVSGGGCLLWGMVSTPKGGVCSWGVSAPEGVSTLGGLLCGGVSALGGLLLGGGGCGIPACTEADTPPTHEQNDKQVQKYYLGHNFVAAGKND